MLLSAVRRSVRARTLAPRRGALAAMVAAFAWAGVTEAQVVPGHNGGIGSMSADRARVLQINGRGGDNGPEAAVDSAGWLRVRGIAPTLRFAWNSALPFEGNDGQLWAGRGVNASVTGGFAYARPVAGRHVSLVVSPTVAYSQNRPFPTRAGRSPRRSAFSSPWYVGGASADLPLRFGDLPIRTLGLGQSSLTVTAHHVAFGVASTNEWWGPAIQNTLLLGDNAAGVPRLFAQTTRPLRTRYGTFEGRALLGVLTESPYFDLDDSNDHRALNGLLVTYRPPIDSGLTLGYSRLVITPTRSRLGVLLHPLDVVFRYQPMRADSDTTDEGLSRQGSDQIFSLFARWVFPQSGFETYVEWARLEVPRTLRQLLEVPQNTQGYTLGLQWAKVSTERGTLRLQAELTYLEQSRVLAGQPTTDFYTGRATVHGFTQRGQVLGAATGPGSSSQFAGADWMNPRWQVGAFVGRARIGNDALYREGGARLTQHDVNVYSGVRGGIRLPKSDISGSVSIGRRYNYLLQSLFYLAEPVTAVDIDNTSVSIRISPR